MRLLLKNIEDNTGHKKERARRGGWKGARRRENFAQICVNVKKALCSSCGEKRTFSEAGR